VEKRECAITNRRERMVACYKLKFYDEPYERLLLIVTSFLWEYTVTSGRKRGYKYKSKRESTSFCE